MRVVLFAITDYKEQFESAPPMNDGSGDNGSAIQKQIDKLTDQISRLMDDYYTHGLLKAEDFKPRYDFLVEERDRLRDIQYERDASGTVRFALQELTAETSTHEITDEQARRLVLALVERVDVPVDVDPKRAGLPKAKRCRGIWVTLKIPLSDGTRRILAPMYDARFLGERLLLDRE